MDYTNIIILVCVMFIFILSIAHAGWIMHYYGQGLHLSTDKKRQKTVIFIISIVGTTVAIVCAVVIKGLNTVGMPLLFFWILGLMISFSFNLCAWECLDEEDKEGRCS